MPSNNEDFNVIENEADFQIEQEKLETSYNILVELSTVEHLRQNKSTWEKNQLAFFKSPGNSCNELNIPSSIVGAYYFAKKILIHLDPKPILEYETHTELLAVCRNWKGKPV